jgi:DNA-binding NarL/FixJ family response regulator
VARADQWIRVADALARERNLPAVSAFCRTHYGGVLTAAGRWREADSALTEAVRLWAEGQRSNLRAGALARLADLRARQGRFEEAEQLLLDVDVDGEPAAARPLAAVHVAQGRPVRAVDVLERALAQHPPASTAAAPLLALLVDVHLGAGSLAEARSAVDALGALAEAHPGRHYLAAAAALARGRYCLAAGTGDPRSCLRDALAGFSRAQMPMELARSRLELAAAVLADRPEVALHEAQAALDAFEGLQAAREADAAAAVLRSLGARPASPARSGGVLTKREQEVLVLLGHGLSNPEISDRLYISRKTVEHHVGNVLAKLGLRGRAEAAAFATRTAPGGRPGGT